MHMMFALVQQIEIDGECEKNNEKVKELGGLDEKSRRKEQLEEHLDKLKTEDAQAHVHEDELEERQTRAYRSRLELADRLVGDARIKNAPLYVVGEDLARDGETIHDDNDDDE